MGDLEKDRNLIRRAMEYRSGADSINSVYMGSMMHAELCSIVGATFGRGDTAECVNKADRATIDRALAYLQPIIDHMRRHPTKRCPTCGGIMKVR